MKTCATRTYLATPAEHLLVLLLIELTLYVRPCAMEMPALLAALLQEADDVQQQMPYDEFPAAVFLTPPMAVVPPAAAAAAADSTSAMNELNERKELLSEAFDKHAENQQHIVDYDGILPPVIATAGVPLKEHVGSQSSLSSSASTVRHCFMVINTKVPGICENMPGDIGSACVAGEYMEFGHTECGHGHGF